MSGLKRKKIASLIALALCLVFAMISVFAFAACDETEAYGDEVGSMYDDPDEYYSFTSTRSGSDIVETVYIENKNAEIIDGFDDNGVAECIFRYDECSICDGDCNGHEMYLTLGGGVYDFYPYCVTIEDGSYYKTSNHSNNHEMQLSLIFDEKPEEKDNFLDKGPLFYEIGSVTEEALDIRSIELSQDYTYILREYAPYRKEYIANYTLSETETSTDVVKIYESENGYETFGHLNLSVAASKSYSYEINFIDDPAIWNGLLGEFEMHARERQDELMVVESENDVFEPSGDVDENGVTEGIYYYDSCNCGARLGMGSVCGGHNKYRSAGGGFYDFYPYITPLTLTDENGSTDINLKLQISLVFDEEPEYNGMYYSVYPVQIEVASLTGEDIEFSWIELSEHVEFYKYTEKTRISYFEEGIDIPINRVSTSTSTAKTFEMYISQYTLSSTFLFETVDGYVFSCDIWIITDLSIFDNEIYFD